MACEMEECPHNKDGRCIQGLAPQRCEKARVLAKLREKYQDDDERHYSA